MTARYGVGSHCSVVSNIPSYSILAYTIGDNVHHSWVKTCRSHQTSCGGMGKTVITVLRDHGMRLTLLKMITTKLF